MAESTLEARLAQLEQAKTLVEADAAYFPQIVLGVLPVFDDPFVELRRWVSGFVLLAFSSSKLSAEDKQDLALKCLERLATSTSHEKDVTTTKNFMQISTIIYPLLFRYVANNPQSSRIWEFLTQLKATILSSWDSTQEGLRINCIKFAQRVVVVQSAGTKDPRLVNKDDISLNLVLADHPLLIERDLTAEAQALLDRLIAVPQDRPGDAVLMTAAINCLCVLAKLRSSFATKIISALLSYDTSVFVIDSTTTKGKLQARFVDKTIRVTLTHLLKINAAGSYGNRIQAFLVGRSRKSEDEGSRKRQASEPAEAPGKRMRSDVDGEGTPQPSVLSIPPLPEGTVSLSTIFNLANDNALAAFDVNQLPSNLVTQIVLATLAACNQEQLDSSVETVRARYTTVNSRSTMMPVKTEPIPGTADHAMTNGQALSNGAPPVLPQPVSTGPFVMPAPKDLSKDALQNLSRECLSRLLSGQGALKKSLAANSSVRDFGLQKVIGGTWNKEAWIGIVTRLSARGIATQPADNDLAAAHADSLRSQLLSYVMTNFRENIDFCASWLNEEWYGETVSATDVEPQVSSHYKTWCDKVLDAVIPFLESNDRLFMRFLSDLPSLDQGMIAKIRTLCVDPDRAQLGYTTLQYLIMLRPPVRDMCLDLIEALYGEDKPEAVQQEKILQKWRPTAIVKTEVTA